MPRRVKQGLWLSRSSRRIGPDNIPDRVVVAAGDVMEASPGRVGVLVVPVTVPEDAVVSPRAGDFADKQIVSRLHLRLSDHFAVEPGRATRDERHRQPVHAKQFHAAPGQFFRIASASTGTP